MQTSTTVGYGDVTAVTNGERTFAIILMIFGVGFYSYTVGNFTSMFSNEDSKNRKLKVTLDIIIMLFRRNYMPSMNSRILPDSHSPSIFE